jgi:hypothetical protein
VKLTTHLHLVPDVKSGGAIPPLLHTPSWRSAQLVKHRTFYCPGTRRHSLSHRHRRPFDWPVNVVLTFRPYTLDFTISLYLSLFQVSAACPVGLPPPPTGFVELRYVFSTVCMHSFGFGPDFSGDLENTGAVWSHRAAFQQVTLPRCTEYRRGHEKCVAGDVRPEFHSPRSRDNYAVVWTTGNRFLAGAINFSFLHSVQIDCGAHPSSTPIGTGG